MAALKTSWLEEMGKRTSTSMGKTTSTSARRPNSRRTRLPLPAARRQCPLERIEQAKNSLRQQCPVEQGGGISVLGDGDQLVRRKNF